MRRCSTHIKYQAGMQKKKKGSNTESVLLQRGFLCSSTSLTDSLTAHESDQMPPATCNGAEHMTHKAPFLKEDVISPFVISTQAYSTHYVGERF